MQARAGRRSAAAAGGPPVVVFCDTEPWECFLQFGAALRRRGIRVERLTRVDRSLSQKVNDALQRPVFSRTSTVFRADASLVPGELEAALPSNVLAVEAVEDAAATLHEVSADRLPVTRTADAELGSLLFDKLAMTEHAQRHGLAVPRTWDTAPGADLLPLMLKPRLGSGGRDIELLTEPAGYEQAAARALADPGHYLWQETVPGGVVHVGGVSRRGELVQAACYRAVGSPHSPMGPSSEVLVIDDPQTMAEASGLISSLGYTGAFCLDYVRGDDGRALLIDVNARIFGSWKALQDAGLDMVGAYLHAVGHGTPAPDGRAQVGRTIRVLPPNLLFDDALPLGRTLGARLASTWAASGALGARWTIAASLRLLSAGLLEAIRRGPGVVRGWRRRAGRGADA